MSHIFIHPWFNDNESTSLFCLISIFVTSLYVILKMLILNCIFALQICMLYFNVVIDSVCMTLLLWTFHVLWPHRHSREVWIQGVVTPTMRNSVLSQDEGCSGLMLLNLSKYKWVTSIQGNIVRRRHS